MKYFLSYIAIILVSIVVAIGHEQDIKSQCKKNGKSGAAGWTISIKCEVIDDN